MAMNGNDTGLHSTLHLAYSLSCNLSCGHCIFRSGPDLHREMGIRRAKRFVEEAARAGFRRVAFTGGEPFLFSGQLRCLILHAAENGMQSAVMTNASWASSRSRITACLSRLREDGLESITVSTDRYHLLGVPFEKVRLVLDAAEKIGLRAGVKIARLRHDPVADGLLRALRGMEARLAVQEISPLGRAATLRSAVELHPASRFQGPGCSSPPLLLPNGNLLTCCNLPARDMHHADFPLVLGNANEEALPALLVRRASDPLLAALRSSGPAALLARLALNEPPCRGPDRVLYHSRCDLCFHLFGRLRDKRPLVAALGRHRDERHEGLGVLP
jgi:hypothetical protein